MTSELMELAERCDAETPDLEGVPGIDFLPACAAESLRDMPLLAHPCAACAYTPGTEANRHPITSEAAKRCVERSHPFFCHLAEDELGLKTHLCAGWADALRARATGGDRGE